jgi:membrane dipeptidase
VANRTSLPGPLPTSTEAQELIDRTPIVDLLAGSALFRDSFVRGGRGHLDLPRARRAGVRIVGLTVATAWPDLRGSLSRWHFRSLGLPRGMVGSHMGIAEWLIGRVYNWCADSDGRLRLIRTKGDLNLCLAEGGPVGIVLGVQGGHVIERSLANIGRLRDLGVRMYAPGHVMDNDLVGSSTGRTHGGLTVFGREAIAELEAQDVIVDVAHMSIPGIEQTLPLLKRPFSLSHVGLTDVAGSPTRWRSYSAATRNVPASLAADVAAAGGLVGIVMATELLGGSALANAVETIRLALDVCGDDKVGIGSDMDGALPMLIDVEGYPALAGVLLESGIPASSVQGFMGGNAVAFLRKALPD